MKEALGFEVRLVLSHERAIERVSEELEKEGFGIISKIDLHHAFKDKLGVDFRPYTILGACNPQLAQRAVSKRLD